MILPVPIPPPSLLFTIPISASLLGRKIENSWYFISSFLPFLFLPHPPLSYFPFPSFLFLHSPLSQLFFPLPHFLSIFPFLFIFLPLVPFPSFFPSYSSFFHFYLPVSSFLFSAFYSFSSFLRVLSNVSLTSFSPFELCSPFLSLLFSIYTEYFCLGGNR